VYKSTSGSLFKIKLDAYGCAQIRLAYEFV
jgi:hypothetical protein